MTFSRRDLDQNIPLLSLSETKKKIMDLVASRDHSEKELRKKLTSRCEPEILEEALVWAHGQNWFVKPETLTEKIAEQLGRRGKGMGHINQKLEELGLSSIEVDQEREYEKAQKLALRRWSPSEFEGLSLQESQNLKAKIMRFLITRGFESDIVSHILKNEFKAGALSHDEEY